MGALRQKVNRLVRLSFRRDDLTAAAGDSTVQLSAPPQALLLFKNGSLLAQAGYSLQGSVLSLSLPLSAGDVLSVVYWGNGALSASQLGP